ncbi:MAG: hypothetical protein HGA23_11635, partial [Bacteroidales bacterium]|nr:hypothetical protein [Bacteroidales bacterium]
KAAVEGKLATRADVSKHQGDFRAILQGVNDTLDAVIGPLNVAAAYVESISKGDIPSKITEDYHGDFYTLKNNLLIASSNEQLQITKDENPGIVNGQTVHRSEFGIYKGTFWSPDGNYLFYTDRGDLFWVSTELIRDLKEPTSCSTPLLRK